MIKKAGIIAALALAAAGCSSTHSNTASSSPSPGLTIPSASSSGTGTCDAALWRHVYHPRRLHVITACLTVTGTVEKIKAEPDGDTHILLKPDPRYADLVNAVNKKDQRGDLVLEEVCVGTVTQADAVAACKNFAPAYTQVRTGDHVRVTGSYVLDADHGWDEIHPVSSITIAG